MLTIENWSKKNIDKEVFYLSNENKVKVSIFSAEKVLGIFKHKRFVENRPRLAIEAAKNYMEYSSNENLEKCKIASANAYSYAAALCGSNADIVTTAAAAAATSAYYRADIGDKSIDSSAANSVSYAGAVCEAAKQQITDYIKELKGKK